MWWSAFKKASVILDNHTQHQCYFSWMWTAGSMQTADFLTWSRWCFPPGAGRPFCGGSFSCGTCRTGCPPPGSADCNLWEHADPQNGLLRLIKAPCLLCKCRSPHPQHTPWRTSGSAYGQKYSGCPAGSSPWRRTEWKKYVNKRKPSPGVGGHSDPDLAK